jgi:hypothetical protein
MIKLRRMSRSCSTNVDRKIEIRYWPKCQKEIDHNEDQGLGGWVIFEYILGGYIIRKLLIAYY